MKKLSIRLLSWFAVIALLCCSVPMFTVSAASDYPNTHVNTGNMAADIVAVAETQYGYCEGSLSGNPSYASSSNYQKYGLWYDNNVDYIGVTRAAWCAAFVSWCANQAGVPSSIVYYHAYCPYGVNWFKNQGRFHYSASRGGSYVPKRGDIIYFAPSGSSTSSHIGIVRYSSGGTVYTVEGNTSGQSGEVNEGGGVFMKSYSLSYSRIMGYGVPAYEDNSGHTVTFESNGGSAVSSVNVRDGYTLSAPAAPTRWGFDFDGWYCNPELTDPYDYNMKVTYGFTLYAKWREAYWGANTNLMPINGSLVVPNYNDAGDRLWEYYNDDGSVTMYSGVNAWAWPSAYMEYANSFDANNDSYIYVKKDGTAYFNALITYMDADGSYHDVRLSELAGQGVNDFAPGYQEFFVDLGAYARAQGHVPASGNLKYSKVTYYVVGNLDEYVKLYDMKLTSKFETEDPYVNLYNSSVLQGGGAGSYIYDGGTFTATADTEEGYDVTFTPNVSFDPTVMTHLLMDIATDVPYNISLTLTTKSGFATLNFRYEFFDAFGFTEAPDALPTGTYQKDLSLGNYFYYNGGSPASTTVKDVTISLEGKGTLTLCALQANRSFNTTYATNDEYVSDSYDGIEEIPTELTSSVYTVDGDYISAVAVGTTAADFVKNFDQDEVVVYSADGSLVDSDQIVATGMVITLEHYGDVMALYIAVVNGDINGDGVSAALDAREALIHILNDTRLDATQQLAADMNGDGIITTVDARAILLALAA